MIDPDLSCIENKRRGDVRAAGLFGLEYAEVSADQLTVTVYFLGKAPDKIEKSNIWLRGGRRIRDVKVTQLKVNRLADPTLDDYMDLTVDKPGDFSMYSISVVKLDDQGHPTHQPFPNFDPRYDRVQFSFKASCPSDLDCKTVTPCPSPQRVQPDINYLAKDYASFRQLILDRLALIMPEWQETHVTDLEIALVELLAYTGDYLSYFQDAVATEAYLGTARQRISVRRHARLVDYQMHDGCSARAWITVKTDTDHDFDPAGIYFITAYPNIPNNPNNRILKASDLEFVPASSYQVFEPLWPRQDTFSVWAKHSELYFYTWGDCQCCLAKGATSATLIDYWVPAPPPPTPTSAPSSTPSASAPPATSTSPAPAITAAATSLGDAPQGMVRALHLKAGDILIFEEVIGPKTGNPADADPTHRQALRLIKVKPDVDPLYHPTDPQQGQPIVEIEWAPEDALTFPLCISSQAPPPTCDCMQNVSVARGNVILVDNGTTLNETVGIVPTDSTAQNCPSLCKAGETTITAGLFRPVLAKTPLTFSQPLPACGSAAALIQQDPRQCVPDITLASIPPGPGCPPSTLQPPPTCQIPPLFTFADLADPTGLAGRLVSPADLTTQFLYSMLSAATKQSLASYTPGTPLPSTLHDELLADLGAMLQTWLPVRDLFESGPGDDSFVVEMDNDDHGHLRFGDGSLGRLPDAGMEFQATYRVGNGPAGSVGAETINYLVLRSETLGGVNMLPRNPMAATGGTNPETLPEVKLFAPTAFRDVLERAITADDYATLAADNARRAAERSQLVAELMAAGTGGTAAQNICYKPFVSLQGAKATLRWTGAWYQAVVALDPLGTETSSTGLLDEVDAYLEAFRRIGHDLEVTPADYVSLDLAMTICVLPNYLRAHVEAALLDRFSNRVNADGSKGFFHADNLTFGQGIPVSQIVAAAQASTGVQNVQVTRLEQYEIGEPQAGENEAAELPTGGILSLGPRQIARLDNDPNFPENGRLVLDMRGGR
jgi:hypothetical protein